MKLHDFYFELPPELIAQTPLADRSASRLLVVDKKTGAWVHRQFVDIESYLRASDCLVINDTRVIPARLMGVRDKTGAKIELLLLKNLGDGCWEALAKPGKRVRTGDSIVFGDGLLTAQVEEVTDSGNRVVRFQYKGIFEEILDQLGEMPLPPYIKEKLSDRERYQTVYAAHDGSAAAPTAGLHFTDALMQGLEEKGVCIARITLHVGLGTFRPVKTENVSEHQMHAERYHIEEEQAERINRAKREGNRVIAVGTTSCRTLEACTGEDGVLRSGSGQTDIFITPGYRFKLVDGLITNFHLPESTLIMLVSALCGREQTLAAYAEAVRERYRFFSFGDACLIL